MAGRHFPMPSPHQVVVFSMECVGFSKSLTAFSTHSPTKSSGKILDLVLGLYMQFAMCGDFFFFCIERQKNFCLQAMTPKSKVKFCSKAVAELDLLKKENWQCYCILSTLHLKSILNINRL